MSPLENPPLDFGLAHKEYPFRQTDVVCFVSGSKEEKKLLQDCKRSSAFIAFNHEQESFVSLPFALTRTVLKTDRQEFLYACSDKLITHVKAGIRVCRPFERKAEKIAHKELLCRRLEMKLLCARAYIEESAYKDFFTQVRASAPFGFESLKSAKHASSLKVDVDLIVQVIFYENVDINATSANKWVMFFAEEQRNECLKEFADEIVEASKKVLKSIPQFKRIDICIQNLFGHVGLLNNLEILTNNLDEQPSRTTKVSFMPCFPLVNAQNLIGQFEENQKLFKDEAPQEESSEEVSEREVEEID